MITNEQFVERVLDSFDKINDKIDKLHKETGEQIEELQDSIAETEKKIDNHLLINKTLEDKEIVDTKNRDRKFYIVLALMTLGFTTYEITNRILFG